MSSRLIMVQEQLRRALCELFIFEPMDPLVRGLIVSQIKIAPDLRSAKVYFTCDNHPERAPAIIKILEKSKGMMRKYIARELNLKFTPDFIFYHDDAAIKQKRIEDLLEQIKTK